jgi:hypothetical protein
VKWDDFDHALFNKIAMQHCELLLRGEITAKTCNQTSRKMEAILRQLKSGEFADAQEALRLVVKQMQEYKPIGED